MLGSVIGWASSAVLILTLAKQVVKLWREGSCEGVSRWLFIGQITASVGFIAYSWIVRNWVFVVTNSLILLDAIAGAFIVKRNRRRRDRTSAAPAVLAPGAPQPAR